jgi:putative oxidoreductase
MKRFLQLAFLPRSYDFALLILRLWLGLDLFFRHGVEKITRFSQMSAHFPDPVHIGPRLSLAFALLSDGICSVLIVLGLATRLAALIVVINLTVAFTLVHHFATSGPRSGELPLVFLGGFLALLIAGPGRYSVDGSA